MNPTLRGLCVNGIHTNMPGGKPWKPQSKRGERRALAAIARSLGWRGRTTKSLLRFDRRMTRKEKSA